VAVCVDTCHIFAAGYDLRTRDEYERTIDSLLEHVGLENVAAFHLNDSKKGLGSRVDRHEHIGEGMLGLAPFEFLLNDDRFARVPKVLETPKSEPPEEENQLDIRNLTKLRSLVAALAS
jgi:deoxyribonuclease-4